MKEPHHLLRETLDGFHTLKDEEFERFLAITQHQTFKKKSYLLHQGNYHSGIYFIISGAVGLYEFENGKENFLDFFLKKAFATDLESLSAQKVSKKNLRALSDCETFFIPRNSLLELYNVSHAFERLGRKMLEHIITEQHKFINVIKSLTPQEQYRYIERNRPELLQQVSLKHLASYLGLARETLSRIRAQK